MNIGLIAHDSKKNLCRISALLTGESSVSMSYLQQELQEDLLKKLLILL